MFWFRITLAFAGLVPFIVSAQDFSAFPTCSLSCLTTIVPTACNLTDIPCICGNQPLLNNVSACVLGACSVRDGLRTQEVTYSLCKIPVRDIGPSMNAIAVGFGAVAFTIAMARIGTRLFILSSGLGWDDYWVLVAVATMFPCTASVFIMTKHGLGRDIWGVPVDGIDTVLQWYYAAMLCYMMIIATTKLSLLCLYLRVFPTPRSRRLTYILLALTGAFWLCFTTVVIFQCTPISGAWQLWDGERAAKCINQNAMVISTSSVNIFLDLSIIVLPLPELYKLNLTTRKKIQAMVVFSLGFFITIVTIIRMQYLVKFQKSSNFTYDNGAAAYWSVIELYVSIICVSLPSLAPLLKMVLPWVFGNSTIGRSKDPRSGYGGYGKNSSIKVQSEVTRTVGPYREESTTTRSEDELQLVDMDPKFKMQTHVSSRPIV